MPLFNCPECKREISTAAANCPHCGYRLAGNAPNSSAVQGALPFSSWLKIIGIPVGIFILEIIVLLILSIIFALAKIEPEIINLLGYAIGGISLLGCVFWVSYDAKQIGYSNYVKARTLAYMSPLGVCCCCLICFPVYLYQREEIIHGLRPRLS